MKNASVRANAQTSFVPMPATLPRPAANPIRRVLGVLTVGVTALSLLMAGSVPAQADSRSDNLAKALVAAIAIGAILNSADKGRAKPAPLPQQPVRSHAPRIPAVCAIEISGKRRDVTVYPERCLRREGFDARLPRQCANEARVFGRVDRVYGEDCLRDAGYRVSRQGGGRGHDDRWRDDDYSRRY